VRYFKRWMLAMGCGLLALAGCATQRPRQCERLHVIPDAEVEQTLRSYFGEALSLTKALAKRAASIIEKSYASDER